MPPRNWRDSIPRPPPLRHPNAKITTPGSEPLVPEQSPPLLNQLISGAETPKQATPVLYPSAGTSNPPGNQSVSAIGGSATGANNLEATLASLSATLQQSPVGNQLSPQSMLSAPNQPLGMSVSSLHSAQKSPAVPQQHLSVPPNHLGASVSSIQTPSPQNHLTVRSSKLGASTSSLLPQNSLLKPNSTPLPQSNLSVHEGGVLGSTTMADTIRSSHQQIVSPRQNLDATTKEELLAQTIGSINQALGMSVGGGTATQLNASQLSPQEDLMATIASLQKGILGNTVPSVSTEVESLQRTGVPHLTVSRASQEHHVGNQLTPTLSGQHLTALPASTTPISTTLQDSLASVLRVATEDIIDKDSLGDMELPPSVTQTPVQNTSPSKKKRKKKVKRGTKTTPATTNQPSLLTSPGAASTPMRTPPSEVLPASAAANLTLNPLLLKSKEEDEVLKSFEGVNLSKYGNVADPAFKKMMAEAVRAAEASKRNTATNNYQQSIETASTSVPPPFALPEDEDEEELPMQFAASIQPQVPKEVVNQQLQVCTFPGYHLPGFPFVSQHPSISQPSIRTPPPPITTPPPASAADLFASVSSALSMGSALSQPMSDVDDGAPDVVTLAKRLAYDLRCRPPTPPPVAADLIGLSRLF